MQALRWLFELRDRISGPANRGSSALSKLKKNLDAVNRATTRGQRRGQRGGQGQGRRRGKEAGFDDMLGGMGKFLKFGAVGVAVGAIASRLGDVVSTITAIGSAMGGVVRSFAQATIEAGLFRQRAQFAMQLTVGSRGGAQEVLAEARELSEFLGTDLHETIHGIQQLMGAGFSRRGSGTIFQALADLRAMSGGSADIEHISEVISQVRAEHVMSAQRLHQLASAGLPMQQVQEALLRRMNLQRVEQLRGRRISADQAIPAILEGIQSANQRALGGVARGFSMTLPGMLDRLQQLPTRFFDAIAERAEVALGGMHGVLKDFLELLDPQSPGFRRAADIGSQVFGVLAETLRTTWDLGRALFDGLFGNIDSDPAQSLTDTLAGIRGWLVELRSPENMAWMRQFGRRLTEAWELSKPLLRGLGWIAAGVFLVVGAIGAFAAATLALPAIITGAVTGVIALIVDALTRIDELAASAWEWGRNIVQGLIGGLMSMMQPLIATASALAGSVTATVTSVLRVGSPSREMMWLGEMAGAGFQRGLDASMPELGLSLPSPGGGRVLGSTEINLHIEVQGGGGDGEQIGNAIARVLLPQLESALAGLSLEEGLA